MTTDNNDEQEIEDYEKVLQDSGLINPLEPCEICGQETRNRFQCAPICPDCESITRSGR